MDNIKEHVNSSDLIIIGIIFVYCLANALLRISISSTFEQDEAEQLVTASVFFLGHDPPLYTWIVQLVSSLAGLHLMTIVGVKYTIIFLFYATFYFLARSFWPARESLLVTGSLMIFHLYAYEFNRDLSHSILVALMAVVTSLLYVKVLSKRKPLYFFLFGVCIGLGIMSKYTFLLFFTAVLLGSLTFREGRKLLSDKRMLLAMLSFILVSIPHIVWFLKTNTGAFAFFAEEARSKGLLMTPVSQSLGSMVKMSTSGLIFILIFGLFFARSISNAAGWIEALKPFRWFAVYGLGVPMLIVVLGGGNFQVHWLSPVLFTLPLAMFSMTTVDVKKRPFFIFGTLCALVVVLYFTAKIFIGFFPDVTKKAERIHVPFQALSAQLNTMLEKKPLGISKNLPVVTDDLHVAANLLVRLPDIHFIPLEHAHREESIRKCIVSNGAIFVWNATRYGEAIPKGFQKLFPPIKPLSILRAHYLYSEQLSPFLLGVAIIEGNEPGSGCLDFVKY